MAEAGEPAAPRSSGTALPTSSTTLVTLGIDPIPEAIQARIRREVAILEAKLMLIEDGTLSANELDLYEWVVEVDKSHPDPAYEGDLVVKWRRIAG